MNCIVKQNKYLKLCRRGKSQIVMNKFILNCICKKERNKMDMNFITKTRPGTLRSVWSMCKVYMLVAPLLILFTGMSFFPLTTQEYMVKFLLWLGGVLFSAFTLVYGSYAWARSYDKKNGKEAVDDR